MRSITTGSETGREQPLPLIERVETIQVRVPRLTRNRITTSYATLPDAHHALVKVFAEGLVGVGEAPAELWWTGEDANSACNAINSYLAPALIGQRIGVREAVRRMESALAWNPYAKAAVEMALWDVIGKQLNVPLYELLGGGPPLPVPVKYVIGILDEGRAAEEARWARQAGFKYLKVKVGKDLEADLRRVQAVIEAAPGTKVGVDANEGWDFPTAMQAVNALEKLGVSFLEQPLSRAHEAGLAELARRSSIPVVLHESIFTARDAVTAAERRLGHIWAVTPSAHGGLLTTLDILALARVHGIRCLLGSTVELGVATAFLAQIASSDRNISECPVPSDIIGPLYHSDDVVAIASHIESGHVQVPAGPGLGVELDDERVRKYQVGGDT